MKKEIIKNRKVSRQRVAVTVIFVQRGPTLQQDNFAHCIGGMFCLTERNLFGILEYSHLGWKLIRLINLVGNRKYLGQSLYSRSSFHEYVLLLERIEILIRP